MTKSCGACRQGWNVGKVARGATGLFKAALHVDRPDDAVVAHRLATCAGCDEVKRVIHGLPVGADVVVGDTCRACGCVIRAKALLLSETCPKGKW